MSEEALPDQARIAWDLLSWEGECQWFAKDTQRVYGGRLTSLDQLRGAIKNAEELQRDFYLQANPTRRAPGAKLARQHVTHWRMIVLDYDPAQDEPQAIPPSLTAETAGAVRVFTGRGWQYWCRFDPVLLSTAGEWFPRDIESAMGAFLRAQPRQAGWKLDTSCSDLARVVRCPGSINWKTGERARVVACYPSGVLKPDDVLQHLPPEPATCATQGSDKWNLLEALPHLNVTTRRYLLEGWESPGRHARTFSAAKNLHELGVPVSKAERWLWRAAQMCRPELDFRDVSKVVTQVYGGK